MSVRPATTVAALVVALAGCSDAAESVSPSAVPTTTAAPTATAVTTSSTAAPTTSSTLANVEVTTTTITTRPEPATPAWDTWTLIYASLPTSEHSRGDAESIAATVEGGSVLNSTDYPSLNAGYWVVYAGEWHSRRVAGYWCPQPLDPGLSCYPRYLGPNISQLLSDGAAIAQTAGRLVVLDPMNGDVLATFSDDFHFEAEFPSHFNLNADSDELYFGLSWEDSWF